MISGVRDHALALACVRRDLPSAHGRGMDRLPPELLAAFEVSLVRRLDIEELSRAFTVAVGCLLNEIRGAGEALTARLQKPLMHMIETARPV